MNKNKNQKAFIDPISLIGIGFLVLTLIVSVATTNNKARQFLISSFASQDTCDGYGSAATRNACKEATKPVEDVTPADTRAELKDIQVQEANNEVAQYTPQVTDTEPADLTGLTAEEKRAEIKDAQVQTTSNEFLKPAESIQTTYDTTKQQAYVDSKPEEDTITTGAGGVGSDAARDAAIAAAAAEAALELQREQAKVTNVTTTTTVIPDEKAKIASNIAANAKTTVDTNYILNTTINNNPTTVNNIYEQKPLVTNTTAYSNIYNPVSTQNIYDKYISEANAGVSSSLAVPAMTLADITPQFIQNAINNPNTYVGDTGPSIFKTAAENALQTISLGTFNDTANAFQKGRPTQEQTTAAIQKCISDGGNPYGCMRQATALSPEQAAATIKLGTILATEIYTAAIAPGIITAAGAAGGAGGLVSSGVFAMGQAQVISTVYQLADTVSYCILNGGDPTCDQKTARFGINAATMGMSRYANLAGTALGKLGNTITTGTNFLVDSGDVVEAFYTNPETDNLTKAMSVAALIGDVGGGIMDYRQGQLGFSTNSTDLTALPKIADVTTNSITTVNIDTPKADIPLVEMKVPEIADIPKDVPASIANDVPVTEKLANWVDENIAKPIQDLVTSDNMANDTRVVSAAPDEIIVYRSQTISPNDQSMLPGGLRNGFFTAEELNSSPVSVLMQKALDKGLYGNDSYRYTIQKQIEKIKELENAGFDREQIAAYALQSADGNVISPFVSTTTNPEIAKNFPGDISIIKVPKSQVRNMNNLSGPIYDHLGIGGLTYENEILIVGEVKNEWIQATMSKEKYDSLITQVNPETINIKSDNGQLNKITDWIDDTVTSPINNLISSNKGTNFGEDALLTVGSGTYKSLGGEKLVIDPKSDQSLQRYMTTAREYLFDNRTDSSVSRVDVLNEFVHESIRYAIPDATWSGPTQLREQIYRQGSPAYLGQFTDAKTGVCREMASCMHVLLADNGKPSYLTIGDVDSVVGVSSNQEGGRHAWVEYIDSKTNQWMVADPTNGYVLPREEAYNSIYLNVKNVEHEVFVWPKGTPIWQRITKKITP